MKYRFDRRVEFLEDGRVLLGGEPTRLLRISAAGAPTVNRWRHGGVDAQAESPAAKRLIERLVDASMLHPQVGERADPERADRRADDRLDRLTVVVPVRDRVEPLRRCLAALVASGIRHIVVVDDGSLDPAAHQAVATEVGAVFVRRGTSGGPAAARMTGWDALAWAGAVPGAGALVGFVDSDIAVDVGWLHPLLAHFDDERVGLIAPRVLGAYGHGSLNHYELANSPLDLGDDPAAIVAGTRVAYVPAAALLVRVEAFGAVDGFDTTLEVGEDVDLLWRLADAGWRCRYEPTATVTHDGRSTIGGMLRRRFDYGRSAALLDARHPHQLPPVRGSAWSLAVVVALLGGHPVVATGAAAWSWRGLTANLRPLNAAPVVAARLTLRGHLGLLRQLARATVRPWFPLTLLVAAFGRRRRRLLIAALVLVAPTERYRQRRPLLHPVAWTALYLADEVAYSAGVWVGCFRSRRIGPLLPEISGVKMPRGWRGRRRRD